MTTKHAKWSKKNHTTKRRDYKDHNDLKSTKTDMKMATMESKRLQTDVQWMQEESKRVQRQ